MIKTMKIDLKSKKGTEIKAGETVTVNFPKEFSGSYMEIIAEGNRRIRTRTQSVNRLFGIKLPSIRQLEKWSEDSICKSVGGKKVEPDGWDSDGTPSWLLVMGLI